MSAFASAPTCSAPSPLLPESPTVSSRDASPEPSSPSRAAATFPLLATTGTPFFAAAASFRNVRRSSMPMPAARWATGARTDSACTFSVATVCSSTSSCPRWNVQVTSAPGLAAHADPSGASRPSSAVTAGSSPCVSPGPAARDTPAVFAASARSYARGQSAAPSPPIFAAFSCNEPRLSASPPPEQPLSRRTATAAAATGAAHRRPERPRPRTRITEVHAFLEGQDRARGDRTRRPGPRDRA